MVKTKKSDELTPMMRQFFNLKAKHPDALLLFRCGDFYETYCQDAVVASQILGITLTRRNNGNSTKGSEMAGFPHHALDSYLPKLVRAGKRVAICDQLEDPKLTKKLVKRGITELVTPGVAMTDGVLNFKENNFLAAIHFGSAAIGLALLDISTGEFFAGQGPKEYVEKLIANFSPKEVLYERSHGQDLMGIVGMPLEAPATPATFPLDEWVFTQQTARQRLFSHFDVASLKGFGIDQLELGVVAAGAILYYLEQTGHTRLSHITSISRIDEDRYVRLDKFTIRSLELLEPLGEGGKSLLQVIDHTLSPMGGRLLRRWLVFPLRDEEAIRRRLDIVDIFFSDPGLRQAIGEQMSRMGDLERIISRAAVGRVSPREMVQLATALDAIIQIKTTLSSDALKSIVNTLNPLDELRDKITQYIVPDPPLQVAKGGVICEGVSAELDELRRIAYSGKDYLLQIQAREAEQTGIQSLKIGYNNVFGYYLEVRNTYKNLVPQEWVRKQTLTGAERYITQELKEYEEKILGAEDRILNLEAKLFADLVAYTQRFIEIIQTNASALARLDCLLSAATAAEKHGYVRPTIDGSRVLDIRQGRHPVIETEMPVGETYVPNDVLLDADSQQIIIITGPNMAGKSALLRQTALITLMAQMGCFVPAQSARIGIVDKIFTRVGASDNISLGESTFMVEMTEASNILNSLTPRSLVLFDELGRGTSTYDGISIAWAIVEHLHQNPNAQARTLFATHYHELNEMEKQFPRIKNFNVSVQESDGKVLFLRTLKPGGSNHSFGIHVAQIAGMPRSIVKRANEVLTQLEANADAPQTGTPQTGKLRQEPVQLSFFQLDDPVLSQVRDEIIDLDIDNLTPIQALNKLSDIRKIVTGR